MKERHQEVRQERSYWPTFCRHDLQPATVSRGSRHGGRELFYVLSCCIAINPPPPPHPTHTHTRTATSINVEFFFVSFPVSSLSQNSRPSHPRIRSPSDSSTFDRTPNLYHAIDPACLSVRRREQRWGGPGVSCSTSITSPPGRCHSRSRDSFSDLFSSGGTPNASWDSTASDRVLDDSELLDGVVWGEDITGRPPGRSRETAASKQRRKTNTRAPQRSAFAIVAAADTALGRALSTSGFPPHDHRQHMHHHNFHRRMKGLKGGASARRALWRSIQSDGSSGSGEAWSPSSVSPRESPPPKYSQSNNRHSAEAPPPCSSLSGQGGGTDSSRAGAAIITTGAVASVDGFTRISPPGSREAVQQRLVTSQMVRKKEQQQQLERWELLLGKCIASVRRSGSGWGEATAAAGLAKNPTACSRNSHERQAADEEIRAKHRRRQQQQQQQQQQRQWLSFSSAPPAREWKIVVSFIHIDQGIQRFKFCIIHAQRKVLRHIV